ncbi:uncharacterized protein LOC127450889 [Myxocyprinus asiaticus]|uniref:uncharacterized protein LOC127450889 n=1 Tax=Myxocyprinus asiaticus TaxID=70543 RepID=UPI0022213798|nr:uncharacterized protein LOC127450889 [Myxocyprinus asiaticus]
MMTRKPSSIYSSAPLRSGAGRVISGWPGSSHCCPGKPSLLPNSCQRLSSWPMKTSKVHLAAGWPQSRAVLPALPNHEAGEERAPVCLHPADPRRLPEMAAGGGSRRRGSCRPGGAGAANPSTAKRNSRVGSVPPPGFAGGSCLTGRGPYDEPILAPWRRGAPPLKPVLRTRGFASPSASTVPCRSPPQVEVSAGAGMAPGPVCWSCRDPGHFRDQCPVMELGKVVRITDIPQAAPDWAGVYRIPVSVKGGTRQALVDTGCNQTSIHQRLVQHEALGTAKTVRVKCVHGDIHNYPVVTLMIKFRGTKHRVEATVSSRLTHTLILGTDWPEFRNILMGICADGACTKAVRCEMCDVLAGEAEPGPSLSAPRQRLQPLPSSGDFPLEQSRDETLKHAFDQVRVIDGQQLQPNVALSYPYFAIINEWLYRVTQDAQTEEDTTQLLIPWSRREMVFQAARYNPMAGHLGERKTLILLIARFYWPGIGGDVRRWCAACRECQLVNAPATPKAPLRPLPLIEVPFERIGMDLVGPLERSARGHHFVLVLVDYETRYPEAVPLHNISARSVAEALFKLISRVGIPKEILTDQGTTFVTDTTRALRIIGY